MVKRFFIIILIIFNVSFSFAQKKNLEIKGIVDKLHIDHVIVPKENFYSLGRMFNLPPKDIAAYNNLQFESGLSVGQTIKVPLNENNFSQSESAPYDGVLIPVYHSLQPKEGLYRVSINYNKVPLSSLKKWNHLKSDEVSVGTPLIVGYLKLERGQASLVGKAVDRDKITPGVTTKVKEAEPIRPDVNSGRLPSRNTDIENQRNKKVTAAEPERPKVTATNVKTKSKINFSGGYFKNLYDDQVEKKSAVNETGSAGVFKSTSGWQDGKYYCFNNDAPPGTIIKITDNLSGKSVYAKVLDAIPDIKQNSGLAIILSNSGAEELGTGETKFDCTLSYVK